MMARQREPAHHPSAMRVLISGLGLMGGSLAAALSAAGSTVLVHHRRPEVAADAQQRGWGTQVADPVTAAEEADVVVVCTPVSVIADIVRSIAAAKGNAIITDVGSSKAQLMCELSDLASAGRFIGSHPMCGSHLQGLANAQPDLYHGARAVITPHRSSPGHAIDQLVTMWSSVGAQPLIMEAEQHDDAVAEASHLPHVLAATAARLLSDDGLPLAATGFRDTTRVAAGSPELWRDILLENREAVQREIGRARGHLDSLSAALAAEDGRAIATWLADAAARRKIFDERDQ